MNFVVSIKLKEFKRVSAVVNRQTVKADIRNRVTIRAAKPITVLPITIVETDLVTLTNLRFTIGSIGLLGFIW